MSCVDYCADQDGMTGSFVERRGERGPVEELQASAGPRKRHSVSRCCHVFFVCSSGDDPDRIVRQRPLQRLCLIPWGAHPNIALLIRHQDDRHGLRVNRLHDGVR